MHVYTHVIKYTWLTPGNPSFHNWQQWRYAAVECHQWEGPTIMSRQLDHLFNLVEGADELGDLSVWTFRRHVSAGHVKVVRLGRRVFVRRDEIDRIREEGLPLLRNEARK